MTNTKYSLYQEENRLTLVIDNPTEETTAMIMKLDQRFNRVKSCQTGRNFCTGKKTGC